MTLYTNGNTPAPLPFRIRLSDGRTRTDPTSFTPEEIADAGYEEAPEPPAYDPETEHLVWADGAWSVEALPPPPVRPVTPRQMRLALVQLDMKAQVDAYVATLDDAALIEWEYATSVERGNPLIAAAQSALELTDAQTDDLFRLAAKL